jgi:hypothetical protein
MAAASEAVNSRQIYDETHAENDARKYYKSCNFCKHLVLITVWTIMDFCKIIFIDEYNSRCHRAKYKQKSD